MKRLKGLMCIGTIGLIIYSAFMLVTPYCKYYVFKLDSKDIVRFPVETDLELKEHFIKRAKELKVPVKDKDIKISFRDEFYRAKISWTDNVNIFDLYKKKFKFNFEVKE